MVYFLGHGKFSLELDPEVSSSVSCTMAESQSEEQLATTYQQMVAEIRSVTCLALYHKHMVSDRFVRVLAMAQNQHLTDMSD
jgi:hypothetical protein